jgi:glycosyltransferase involved in cell wall biosynthesis
MTQNRWLQRAEWFGSPVARGAQRLSRRGFTTYGIWRESGLKGVWKKVKAKTRKIRTGSRKEREQFRNWVAKYDTLSEADREAISARILHLSYKPLISVVMPVYNIDERWLRLAIESVCKQLYPHWELCIADDGSSKRHIRRVLDEYQQKDHRIKVIFRETRGHISVASNSALELAEGEFIALLDHDDELAEHALYMVAEELNVYPHADLIYSDEDKLDNRGRRIDPHFKSDWNPDLFYSYNFISHLGVYRRSVVKELGGFREGYEGSQDYDLVLRVIEQIPEDHIRHIPHVLYHWRVVPGSMARSHRKKEFVDESARKAIRSHFQRKGINATVTPGSEYSNRVSYPLPADPPLVSVIVATRDHVNLIRQIADGILHRTDYKPLELIIVDNQSSDPATMECLRELQNDSRVRVIPYEAPFNFSAINNVAAREATGQILALVNNDIRTISSEWLTEMVSHAVRPEIGAVGAKLYYENETIQHAGIIVGIGGVAGHAHKRLPRQSTGYFARAQVIQNWSAVTGACLVMRRQVYDEVGGLDEVNLPIAFNDVDLCLRIREKGYRILWTPYAELYHLESASRGADTHPDKLPRFTREQEFMKFTWKDRLLCDPYYSPNLTLHKEDFSFDTPRTLKPWRNNDLVNSVYVDKSTENAKFAASQGGVNRPGRF